MEFIDKIHVGFENVESQGNTKRMFAAPKLENHKYQQSEKTVEVKICSDLKM